MSDRNEHENPEGWWTQGFGDWQDDVDWGHPDREPTEQELEQIMQKAHDDAERDRTSNAVKAREDSRRESQDRLFRGVGPQSPASTATKVGFQAPPEPKEPKPVEDDQGNVLSREEVIEALHNIYESALDIDATVKREIPNDPEAQANKAADLAELHKKQEKALLDYLRDLDKFERESKVGTIDFGMESPDDNKKVCDLVQINVDRFESELQKLKEDTALRIREGLDEEFDEPVPAEARDKVYEALVADEVIETWEPLEF